MARPPASPLVGGGCRRLPALALLWALALLPALVLLWALVLLPCLAPPPSFLRLRRCRRSVLQGHFRDRDTAALRERALRRQAEDQRSPAVVA